MIKNKNKGAIALTALSGLMMASSVSPVFASTVSYNIDPAKKGSITLYKYESEDGKHKPGNFIAEDVSDVAMKGIAGVGYKYIKIGDLKQVASHQNNTAGLYYTLDANFLAELKAYGCEVTPTLVDGVTYYTAESVNAALKALHTTGQAYDNTNDGSLTPNERMIKYVDGVGTAMPDTDQFGMTTVKDLEQGLYMVAEVKHPATTSDGKTQYIAKSSAPFLMPLPMTNVAEVDGHPAGTVWQYDLVAYPKSEMISIRKDIVVSGNDTEDGAATNGLVQKTDKNVGEYVDFLLTLDVPALQPQHLGTVNKNRKFIISDTMTQGLTLDSLGADNFVLKYGQAAYNAPAGLKDLVHGTDFTVTANNQEGGRGFTLTMTEAGLAKFDELTADSKLYVRYSARINADAVRNEGNIKVEGNEYKLTYGTSTSKDHIFESNKDVESFTYEVNLLKQFTHNVADRTQVTFNAFHVDPATNKETTQIEFIEEAKPGHYHVFDGKEDAAKKTTTLRVDASGNLCIKGLDNGVFSIKEMTTVGGYNLLRDPIILTIKANHPENGKVTSATIKNGAQEVEIGEGLANGLVNFTIVNNETISDLHTGGNGWNNMIYLVGGTSLVAGMLIIAKKKKEVNE